MPKVLIQAGHNAPEPLSSGAPGERAWVLELAHAIIEDLNARGVDCDLIGGFYNLTPPPQVKNNYALFVSLHYDAAVYGDDNTGCFADRATDDPAGADADRFIKLWESIYPDLTGIPLRNNRRNANTHQYYAFNATTAATPGVIIEHGVGQGLDHDFLFNDQWICAEADAHAICEYLGVAWDEPAPEPAPAAPSPAPAPEDPIAAALRLANWIKFEFEKYIRDGSHKQSVDNAASAESIAPADLMIRWGHDHAAAGEEPPY